MTIIQLTIYPYKYPIAFETTGIKIVGTSRDRKDRAIVNDISVEESFNEVLYALTQAREYK